MTEIVIVAAKRSPIGSMSGQLSSLSASAIAVQVINGMNINKTLVDTLYVGNVISTGTGQNIARKIGMNANINVPSYTINNVCGSGLQAIFEGINAIKAGVSSCVLAGGVESMSNAPHIALLRTGTKYGNIELKDSMLYDGLTDMFCGKHMGLIADETAAKHRISREEQDTYSVSSYERANFAQKKNLFKKEIVPIKIEGRKEETNSVIQDEQIAKSKIHKVSNLRPAFCEHGTITAGNASKLGDGASFVVLCTKQFAVANSLEIMAEVISTDTCVGDPNDFTLLPSESIIRCLSKANLKYNDIDSYEVNEAFSICPIYISKTLKVPMDKINTNGGSIAMGHPLGCSGARILTTLTHNLIRENLQYGCASLCIGGGGACSVIIKNVCHS